VTVRRVEVSNNENELSAAKREEKEEDGRFERIHYLRSIQKQRRYFGQTKKGKGEYEFEKRISEGRQCEGSCRKEYEDKVGRHYIS